MVEVINLGLNKTTYFNSECYGKLTSIGCCKVCSLRFSGETKPQAYVDLYNNIDEKRYLKQHTKCSESNAENDPQVTHAGIENGVKLLASNPCTACLGMLQPPMSYKFVDKILDAINREDYDSLNFNIAFTLPISFYLRAHALLVFLTNKYPEHVRNHLPLGLVTVGVKDAWKYIFVDKISERIHKKFDSESDYKVQVDIQYEDDHEETSCLLDMYPNKFKEQKIKAKRLRHLKGPTLLFSRKTVESVLVLEDREHFAQMYPIPPPIPTHAANCNTVLFEQAPLYIAGRYNKFVRELPQTAWLVQDQRKLETSVHELIAAPMQDLTKAKGSKLISSGREDVDVRMLGSGRPFAMELLSPRHVLLSDQELSDLEHCINSNAINRVAVNRLKVVSKSAMQNLKDGEEHKTKTYVAWCVVRGVDVAELSTLPQLAPLTLQQRTPVRVLHRRPIAVRPRTVHWIKITDIQPSTTDDSTYFKLTLNTQAGTYIKEFVHGDFGRTKPSLGDLLGGASADCLALDVQIINLDWPPR